MKEQHTHVPQSDDFLTDKGWNMIFTIALVALWKERKLDKKYRSEKFADRQRAPLQKDRLL